MDPKPTIARKSLDAAADWQVVHNNSDIVARMHIRAGLRHLPIEEVFQEELFSGPFFPRLLAEGA